MQAEQKFEIGERVINVGVPWKVGSVIFDNVSRIYRYKLEPIGLGRIKWVREDEIEYND